MSKTTERTVKYVGNGAWLSGVPARDLTMKEYEACKAQIEQCTQQLYVVPEPPKTTKASSKNEDGE